MREGCEVHTGDLREADERPRARRAAARTSSTWPRSSAASRNFHKLPFTLIEVNNALTARVFRAVGRAATCERFVYVSSSMVFERATEFPTTEEHVLDVPDAALGLRVLEAGRRGLHPRRPRRARAAATRSAARSTPTAPARCPSRRARDRPRRPGPDPQGARRAAAAADLRLRRADAHADPRRRHRRRDRHRDGLPAGENEDFNISASEELTVAEIARLIWEACGNDPAEFELEHLPSFEVDVQRRWPSVEKARRAARLGGAGRPARRDRPRPWSGCAALSATAPSARASRQL